MAYDSRALAPIFVTFVDGERLPILHLRKEHIRSLDALIHRIESGFGYAQVLIAHGRVAGYEQHETIRVVDQLTGQRPPSQSEKEPPSRT